MNQFHEQIDRLDIGLFRHVVSQSTDRDKASLLALQSVVRQSTATFVYLEIGSYRGGSLQPHVIDPKCSAIVSIDPRPDSLPDSRGKQRYPENSTAAMIEALRKVPGASVAKIKSIEAGTDSLDPSAIQTQPDYCFIDGEHTDEAALRDARFCLSVVKKDGLIAFHDANLIYGALAAFIQELQTSRVSFRASVLPDSIFAIELGHGNFFELEPLRSRIDNSYQAYLSGMLANDWYRYAYHLPIYRMLRKIRRFFPK
jgi:hypothetical protein